VSEVGLNAEGLFDKCNLTYASVTVALGKVPQVMVEHSQVMIDWMQWRVDNEHLYDTALFYIVEAEYQLHEAKLPTLLTRPSEETIQLADQVLDQAKLLKERVISKSQKDMEELGAKAASQGERLKKLESMEKEIEKKLAK
jgi:hypothetical protein